MNSIRISISPPVTVSETDILELEMHIDLEHTSDSYILSRTYCRFDPLV